MVLMEFLDREDLGTNLVYWMSKFLSKTDSDYDFYTNEMRKIYDKYAQKSDDENSIFVPREKVELFKKAVKELEETEAEDPKVRFKLSELSSGLKLSMKQMYPLLDFVDEEN